MQNINLYLPEFRPNRQPLRALHMVWIAAVLLVLLAAYSVYSSQRNSALAQTVAAEQASLKELQQQVQTLSLRLPVSARPGFETEVERLKTEIERRQQITTLIAQQNLGNAEGFSQQMQSMARQSLETLQVNNFSLQTGGSYMELHGRVRGADQVPLYLQRLRAEESFRRVRFGVVDLERDDRGTELNFSVSRSAEEKR